MELSQEKIAEIAQASETIAIGGKKGRGPKQVRPYDFTHPDKLSRGHLRVLQFLMSGLERSWSNTLSAMLKVEAVVTVDSLEQMMFDAYSAALPERGLIIGLSLGQLPGISLLDLPSTLALAAVDRLAGGGGKLPEDLRGLTQIERKIITRLLARLMADFAAAWRTVIDLDVTVTEFYDSVADIAAGLNEMLLVTSFTWRALSTEHKVALAIPLNALGSIRDLLTPEHWLEGRSGEGKTATSATSALLGSVRLETTVELGRAQVSMQELLSVGVGDVIRLDRAVNDPLDINVQGTTKFYGRPGLVGNRLAVQITEHMQEVALSPVEEVKVEQQEEQQESLGG